MSLSHSFHLYLFPDQSTLGLRVSCHWFLVGLILTVDLVQRVKSQNFQDNLNRARGKPPKIKPLTDEEVTKNTRNALQQKIEDLSALLGVEPVLLASAIAGVVKPHMPAESSSSISSQAKASDSVLSAFADGMKSAPSGDATAAPTATVTSEGGMAASILSAVKGAGFDDMGMDTD